MVEVVAIVDISKAGIYKKIDGVPVVFPDDLASLEFFDYLIICALDNVIFEEIINSAMSHGIKREIILPVRIFSIPFFDFDAYIRIKNSNISILSDYCFAGILYHRFGMRFSSPTINMYSDNENYMRFLKDIEGHLAQPMVELNDPVENRYLGIYSYPKGIVGDSVWLFNHDVSFETAAARWKRGVERFNSDNFLVIMAIMSDDTAYEFDALPIKHKIGFFWKDLGLKSVVYMPEWNDPNIRAKCYYAFPWLVNRAADERNGIRSINWMNALLHKEDYRRVS